jgi:predicted RNA-binding Zn-ribbon protein involved in translation (DUF1610 family)
MAYACPKCGAPVQRGSSATAQHAAGLVGALLYAAFAGFVCAKCGKLERSAFPPEVQSQMTRNSALMAVGAVVLFVAVIGLVVAINS